jgi:hypothetical protein
VAIGALTTIVAVRRCVARLAVDKAGVVKGHIGPVVSDVAIGTLTAIVVGWCVTAVARLAIDKAGVVKDGAGPVIGAIVTIGALAIIVIDGCILTMARQTISGGVIVIEGHFAPVLGGVASGALTTWMPRRSRMARLAIGVGYMVKDDVIPLLGADVAVGALAGPVTRRCNMA